jgi:ribosomal protein S18 acetylase RimI-like enzyme
MGNLAQEPPASAQGERRIVHGPEAGAEDAVRSRLLPWVLEAAQPYARYLYGDDGTAAAVLAATMRRRGSDLALARAVILISGDDLCGVYFAIPGAELPRCRRHEFVEAMRIIGFGGLGALRDRMDALAGAFPPVADDEFYLSKLAVAPGMRGLGFARALLDHHLRVGARLGFRKFRLDVSADNAAAVRLYESRGYRVAGRSRAEPVNLEYLSMTLAL